MGIIGLFLVAVGLSMDAFAVAVCKGLSMKKADLKKMLVVGLYFGGFQALMPAVGYLVGSQFSHLIERVDHWIAFVLLGLIGINMIIESRKKECDECGCQEEDASLKLSKMLPLAIATSIDALAVGVTFAFIHVEIVPAVAFIGVITLTLSMIGVKIGNVFGSKFKSKAEFIGGLILILMGVKILLEHLGVF